MNMQGAHAKYNWQVSHWKIQSGLAFVLNSSMTAVRPAREYSELLYNEGKPSMRLLGPEAGVKSQQLDSIKHLTFVI